MDTKMFSCEGKVAVVTGGAGLLGRATANALSRFGARVFVADLDSSKNLRACREMGVEFVGMDISVERSVRAAMKHVRLSGRRLDILVNCAYPRTKDWGVVLEDIPFESWKNNCDSHLGGYFLACRTAAELMKKQGGGTIINFASIYGVVAPDFGIYAGTSMTMPAAYSAIKGGVIAFTKYLAAYYGRYNIRCNSISPGGIYDGQNPAFVRRYCRKVPLGRMGTPQDIPGTVVYLASEASAYVTGCNLMVDGGWVAW